MASRKNSQKSRKRLTSPVTAPKHQRPNGKPDKEPSDGGKHGSDIAIAIATVVIAVATVATGVVACLQWGTLQDATDAAEKSAIAASESVEATRETMRLDQRAWLGIAAIKSVPRVPETGKPIEAIVEIRNSGKTPARNIVVGVRGEPVEVSGRPIFSYDPSRNLRIGTLFPNSSVTLPLNMSKEPNTGAVLPLSQGSLDAIAKGHLQIYVHGRVDYEDVFGAPHWTEFCGKLNPTLDGHYGACQEHNDTDDYKPK